MEQFRTMIHTDGFTFKALVTYDPEIGLSCANLSAYFEKGKIILCVGKRSIYFEEVLAELRNNEYSLVSDSEGRKIEVINDKIPNERCPFYEPSPNEIVMTAITPEMLEPIKGLIEPPIEFKEPKHPASKTNKRKDY